MAVGRLAEQCDILTTEIGHVDTEVLEGLATGAHTRDDWRHVKSSKIEVYLNWCTIRVIQDNYEQKEYLMSRSIPTARSLLLDGNSTEELENAAK